MAAQTPVALAEICTLKTEAYMTKFFLGLILIFTMFSCKKDEITLTPNKDETSFLDQTTKTFNGKIDGATFSWTFGVRQSQSTAGYENGNGVCDSTDPVRIVFFGLTSESNLQNRFTLYTPKYNSTSGSEYSQIFSPEKRS